MNYTKEDYINNPGGTSSLPYWKSISIELPENLIILHNSDKDDIDKYINLYDYDIFFKLVHDYKNMAEYSLKEPYYFKSFNKHKDIPMVKYIINNSYEYIHVEEKDILNWTKEESYDEDLWVFIMKDNKPIGLCLGNFDINTGECSLEWMQILPEYRRKGLGFSLIMEILNRSNKKADFATVSGDFNNEYNPKGLYKKCGFKGKDLWYVIDKNKRRK